MDANLKSMINRGHNKMPCANQCSISTSTAMYFRDLSLFTKKD